jgi:FtsP/CotA-like multicopper oxidase with cupredoxin domain
MASMYRQRSTRPPGRLKPLKDIVLLASMSAVAILVLTACNSISTESNVGEYDFETPLEVPPLLEPEIDEEGRKIFDLAFNEGETELIPGMKTETWGLNGTYLGPTIRASRGDDVVVNVRNDLDETTTLHWHGMHLPARMDGGPHQMIEPDETWSPEWTIDQPAASLWFHPHMHGATADHVYRGAAGMFLIDDPELDDLGLPSEYGIDDIPLIVQDKQFHPDGKLDFSDRALSNLGILGDEILVNGTYAPVFEANTSLVRFRVLNASNARFYNFGFDDDRQFDVIGSDTGLLTSPVSTERLQLSPGERAEIVVQVNRGDDVMLRSYEPDLQMDFWNERVNGGRDTFDILRIAGAQDLTQSPRLPDRLVEIADLVESDAAVTRIFELNDSSRINDQPMDMNRVDEVVEVNTTEIWEVTNASGMVHNFHIHLIHFQVLDIDGESPPAHLRGWKDTVFIPRGSTVRLIAEFKDYADPAVPYMYHCHILRHEDRGMMGQFVVVEPGMDVPSWIPVDSEHEH